MKLSAYVRQLGISYQTAWRMWQRGEFPAHQLPSGTVIVEDPSTPTAARVSSTENRTNLDGQAEPVAAFCAARGWQVAKVVKERGSGVNDRRPQLLALRADTRIGHMVVEHKDRCSRFGVAIARCCSKRRSAHW
jgi:predicted site-specific integrase-resolvase